MAEEGKKKFVPTEKEVSTDELADIGEFVDKVYPHIQALSREVRVVDPITGGEKGAKLARFSLIPSGFVWALAEHYGQGAKKYADRNWERGYKWSLSLDASQRHLNQWLMGEDNDGETGSSHLVAAAWHLVALWFFHKYNKGTDDIRLEEN